jgi:hypothetical protein
MQRDIIYRKVIYTSYKPWPGISGAGIFNPRSAYVFCVGRVHFL